MDSKKPKALVICPTFFDYYKNIIYGFEELGFDAIWINTWLYKNSIYKALLRFFPGFISRISTSKYIRNIEDLDLDKVSEVLVIKGEGLSSEFIKYLRCKFSNANFSLYLWDGIANSPGASRIAPAFDSVSTFDPRDAQAFNWLHRPLFARHTDQEISKSNRPALYDWVFIGSLHSDRFSVLNRLSASQKKHEFYAYGFIPGRLIWLMRHIFNPKLLFQNKIEISTKSISSDQINQFLDNTKAVVDIEHPKQRGLTMRSIETLLLGRKLVTTNIEIKNSDLFHESRVYIIDRNKPSIPRYFLESSFLEIPSNIRSKYILKNWLEDFISTQRR